MLRNRGFALIEALIASGLMVVVGLGIGYTVMQANSNNTNLQSQIGSQALRQSVTEAVSSSLICTPRFSGPAPSPAPVLPNINVAIKLDDGTPVQAGQSLTNYGINVQALQLKGAQNLGADPCNPNNTLYSGALVITEQKSAAANATAGGQGLHDETLGNLAISVNNSTNAVSRCTAGSPTDICDPCLAINGTYVPGSTFQNGQCIFKNICPFGEYLAGYNGTTPICGKVEHCPSGYYLVSDGGGNIDCQPFVPSPSPSPVASPVASASPSPGTSPSPSASPSPGSSPGCTTTDFGSICTGPTPAGSPMPGAHVFFYSLTPIPTVPQTAAMSLLTAQSLIPNLYLYATQIDFPIQSYQKGLPGFTQLQSWFGMCYDGSWTAPTTGAYTFVTEVDDAVALFIDGNLIGENNNNDLLSSTLIAQPLRGDIHFFAASFPPVNLSAGSHVVEIMYYQAWPARLGDQVWVLPPGMSFTAGTTPADANFMQLSAPKGGVLNCPH